MFTFSILFATKTYMLLHSQMVLCTHKLSTPTSPPPVDSYVYTNVDVPKPTWGEFLVYVYTNVCVQKSTFVRGNLTFDTIYKCLCVHKETKCIVKYTN